MAESAGLPITCVGEGAIGEAGLAPVARSWADANGFTGQRGRLLPLPGAEGALAGYLFGLGDAASRPRLVAGLAGAALPPGHYSLAGTVEDPTAAALAFRLGAYRFTRYREGKPAPELVTPAGADAAEVARLADAAYLARDLINTPANDLGPEAFEREIRRFAERHAMEVEATVGDALLRLNFPMIHAVGRAGAEAPRLLDLRWGKPTHSRLTLVGKGVTFDTGGLDIKPSAGMLLMKKDMGGAANVLALAHAIMDARLKVRLRVLLPIVENAISGGAFRPGDVLRARNGTTVEIGNTDAEGRLILGDAISFADEESPELILDMATLTGAARTALGPELPCLFSTDDGLADALQRAGGRFDDALWRMPLWANYESMLDSRIADINNVSSGSFAGAVTAALFLKRFARNTRAWVHLDIFGWAAEARAGHPVGGTEQGLYAAYTTLAERYR